MDLKNENHCDGCDQLEPVNNLGQHTKCNKYGVNMLPCTDVALTSGGKFEFLRLEQCKNDKTH